MSEDQIYTTHHHTGTDTVKENCNQIIGVDDRDNRITAQQAEVERLKEELDTFRKACSVCGGSGYRDINKTVSAKEPVIGVHIEHQRVKCSHCKDGYVPRMVVTGWLMRIITMNWVIAKLNDADTAELIKLDMGRPLASAIAESSDLMVAKLTRLPDGMWEITEVKE